MRQQWGWILSGMIVCLICSVSAAGGTISNHGASQSSGLDDGVEDLPAAQLSGWFSGSPPGFSDSESDFSQPWTSPQNIATMKDWASLVARLSGHPELLAQLYGLGMTNAQNADVIRALIEASNTTVTNTGVRSKDAPVGNVPEPVTLGSLGCALVILGLYARKRGAPRHVTLRKPD
jgi:hypothetical protein